MDGPFVRIPDGSYDAILVSSLTESLGCLERFVAAATEHLAEGGVLLVSMENLAAPRSVRFVLEGRPGNTDPFGSLGEPERRVHATRVIRALATAGLLVEDTFQVPSRANAVGPEFLRTIFREGFLALPYLAGIPPARVWMRATKRALAAGSVLVGSGPPGHKENTLAALRGFLPADWEVVECEEGDEPVEFNRALTKSSGDVIWFLRAGTIPEETLFQNLLARTVISPAAPGEGEELTNPGDISGLMALRSDVFAVGPFAREFTIPQITYEDWMLRIEATGRLTHPVTGGYEHAQPAAPDRGSFEAESKALMDKWAELEIDPSGFASDDNPHRRASARQSAPWGGRIPRLSLCMIARDEERFLGRCLESAAPIADEIIVVDTGSTDRTVEIAESFGAKVIRFEWCDDFAAARNVALRAATGDWILSLDADEALRPDQHEILRKDIEDPGISGYHLRFKNHHTHAKTAGVVMIRLFRKLDGVHWENRIHEQMTTSLMKSGSASGLQLSISDVTVDHYGYLDEVMESRNKNERNDRLFKAHLAEKPDDIYMLYKYGDFLRRTTNRWRESLSYLRRAFDMVCAMPPCHRVELPYAAEIAALAALEYRRADNAVEADLIVQTALRDFVCTPNLHYLAAGLAVLRGAPDEAIGHYQRCIAFRDQVLVVPIQEGITSYVSITGIAQAYMQKGQRDKAERLLQQSIRFEPGYEVSTLLVSRLHLERGDLRKALLTLTNYLGDYPDSAGVCQQAALLLKELGYTSEAERMANRAIQLLEGQSLDFEANQLKERVFAPA